MVKVYLGIGIGAVLAVLGACSSDSDGSGTCATLKTCCSQIKDASSQAECTSLVMQGDDDNCGAAQDDFTTDSACVVSTSTSGTSGCSTLSTCCTMLASTQQTECDEVVAAGDDTTCGSELTAYQTLGSCTSVGVSTTLSGCSGLTTCCTSLTSEDQPACEAEISAAGDDDTTCGTYLTAYQSLGMCGGTGSTTDTSSDSSVDTGGTGCSGLSSCCSSLSSDLQPGCQDVVSEGNDTECSEELSAYMEADECGGSTTTTSDSSSTGGGCSALSSCCSSLSSDLQPGCQDVVSEGNDTECSEELSAYMESGSCT